MVQIKVTGLMLTATPRQLVWQVDQFDKLTTTAAKLPSSSRLPPTAASGRRKTRRVNALRLSLSNLALARQAGKGPLAVTLKHLELNHALYPGSRVRPGGRFCQEIRPFPRLFGRCFRVQLRSTRLAGNAGG